MENVPFLGEYGHVSMPVKAGKNLLPIVLFLITVIGAAYYFYWKNQEEKKRKLEQEEFANQVALNKLSKPPFNPSQHVFLPR